VSASRAEKDRTLVVIGATGDVGRGVVAQSVSRGWRTIAVARAGERLRHLAAEYGPADALETVVGNVGGEAAALALAEAVDLTPTTSVVNAISAPWSGSRLAALSWRELSGYLESYLGAHLIAARVFLPRLGAGTVYLGIGGGMADWTAPGLVPVSMAQAAQRVLYQGLDQEFRDFPAAIRELMVVSKVAGHSNRGTADPRWLTDLEVGMRACDIVADPCGSGGRSDVVIKMTMTR
jgi:NAD(P)-dependent dehydrogenase (short-subunit alcohol dehydrogenase family)